MRARLLLVLLISCLVTTAGAANYACRDSEGKLYFTDSPAALPEDCLQNMKQIFLRSPSSGGVSAPASEEAKGPGRPAEVGQTPPGNPVSEEVIAGMLRRAEDSAKLYAQGVQALDEANQRRRFGSKARFSETQRIADAANQLINEARQEKKQLISELDSQQVPAQQRADIVKQLEKVR